MKSPLYRQWVAYTTVIAMLFGMIAPVAICKCVDCNCPKSKIWLSEPATNEKCACLPQDEGCSTSTVPCKCLCCDIQNDGKVTPVAVLSAQKQNYSPMRFNLAVSHVFTKSLASGRLPFSLLFWVNPSSAVGDARCLIFRTQHLKVYTTFDSKLFFLGVSSAFNYSCTSVFYCTVVQTWRHYTEKMLSCQKNFFPLHYV